LDQDARNSIRQVLLGLVALLGVSVLIGGVLSVVALGAADLAGVTEDTDGAEESVGPSLYMPTPTPSPAITPAPGATSAAPAPRPSATPRESRPPRPAITLSAHPKRVSAGQRINLTGRYRARDGRVVQVQRHEGRWVDFPTSATVRGGRFSTYVITSRTGDNRFRVRDESTGRASNPVTVSVG
jgi:hypothetical protein